MKKSMQIPGRFRGLLIGVAAGILGTAHFAGNAQTSGGRKRPRRRPGPTEQLSSRTC